MIDTVQTRASLRQLVHETVRNTVATDMHTHLFAPEFGPLNLWGIDELLTYHYLVAEFFRASSIRPDSFFAMPKTQQADAVWETLFVRNSPISEACRGVITVLHSFGLNPNATDLRDFRAFFGARDATSHIDDVLKRSRIRSIVMTNDPFDTDEKRIWENGLPVHEAFKPALRIDRMLNTWADVAPLMQAAGYKVDSSLHGESLGEARRFLGDWIQRMKPLYLAASFPGDFQYPDASTRGRLLDEAVLPVCKEFGLPFGLMIGVRRAANPQLRLAGDSVMNSDVSSIERICAAAPEVTFLTTLLARENQHALCVAARKFSNLMIFGCWWFTNIPSMIDEITRMRIELLGPTFIPIHSDSRVFEQLLYKWEHARTILADAMVESYARIAERGRTVTAADVTRDVELMFSGNFATALDRR